MSEFVIIKNGDTGIVGKFGVDSVQDGKCPDGIEYSWVKRRIAQKLWYNDNVIFKYICNQLGVKCPWEVYLKMERSHNGIGVDC